MLQKYYDLIKELDFTSGGGTGEDFNTGSGFNKNISYGSIVISIFRVSENRYILSIKCNKMQTVLSGVNDSDTFISKIYETIIAIEDRDKETELLDFIKQIIKMHESGNSDSLQNIHMRK